MYFKDFDGWNIVKKQIQEKDPRPHVRAGEIRWASVGTNIGTEIDGKGRSFTRPVLVLHVVGHALALVVPFSTKVKDVAGYVPFEFNGTITALCIHQMRVLSQRRLLTRTGQISQKRLAAVKSIIWKFYSF